MFCPNCGAALVDQSPFCGHCGTATSASGIVARKEVQPYLPIEQAKKASTGMKSLLTAGYVCALVALIFLPPAFSLAAIVIGILVLARGKVGHGIAIIVIGATCGYVGMYFGDFVWRSFVTPRSYSSQPSDTAPLAPTTQDWHVVSIKSRVTESNDVYSQYSWKLTIRNDSDLPAVFYGTVEFQDADGFELTHEQVNLDRGQVPAASDGEIGR